MRVPSIKGFKHRGRAAEVVVRRKIGRARIRMRLRQTLPTQAKVHLGCGLVHLEGWTNVDNRAVKPGIHMDLRYGFPAPSSSVALVFSEHAFEHLSLEDGCRLFADCHLALTPGGFMRISRPDLRYLVDRPLGDWRNHVWLRDPPYRAIDSPARMLNFALRSWDHLYIYDLAHLTLRLKEAGFTTVDPKEFGQSLRPELGNLERRPDSLLIVEAAK